MGIATPSQSSRVPFSLLLELPFLLCLFEWAGLFHLVLVAYARFSLSFQHPSLLGMVTTSSNGLWLVPLCCDAGHFLVGFPSICYLKCPSVATLPSALNSLDFSSFVGLFS